MAETFTWIDLLLVGLAALAAGLVNALAGGGTLISFPALTFAGMETIAANVTNTVALTPGYLGATFAQWKDMQGQKRRLWLLVPTAAAGGLTGGLLLLSTNERLFRELVPWLILLAAALLASQERVRSWVVRRAQLAGHATAHESWVLLPVFVAAIYGGYFGAGLSVIVLAVLGLVLDDSLTRLNALKQAIAFAVNVSAALLFLFSGQVAWTAALVMAVGALLGGLLGGRLAGAIRPQTLRAVVITVAVLVAIIYFVR